MGARTVVSTVVVAGLLLAGVAVGADRFAVARAQGAAASAVTTSVDGVVGTPQVRIAGFPFLTQLWRDDLQHVTGRVDALTVDGVRLDDVTADARGVHPDTRRADHVTLTASVPTAAVASVLAQRTGLTGLTVRVQDAQLVAGTSVLGLTVQVTGTPRVSDGSLVLDIGQVRLGGNIVRVDALPAALRERLDDLRVPLTGLPAGLALTAVDVLPTGLHVTATGTDVSLPTR